MSLSADLKAFADRLDTLGEEAVTKTEAIVASPVGTTALTLVHDVVGLNIDPKIIESALGGLQALLQAYAADTAPASPAADGTPAAPAAA